KSISRSAIYKSGVGCCIYFIAFGDRASLTASLSSIKLSTVNARAPAGKNNTWRLFPERTGGWAAAISLPHDTTDGGRPIPKNDRVASATMYTPSDTVAVTMTGGRALGMMWVNKLRHFEAPRERAASTNSRFLISITAPRAIRVICGQPKAA